jgi:peptidoglycan/LPS O-acetylase OafA/YrhL
MSPLQYVVFLIAVPALIYAALLIWWVVWEELREWFAPEDHVWAKADHPARQPLVTVRNERGRVIAVRADQAHKWDDRHEGTE